MSDAHGGTQSHNSTERNFDKLMWKKRLEIQNLNLLSERRFYSP